MQKLYWLFCGIIVTSMTKITILPPNPLGGVKGQMYKFRNNSVNCQYAAAWKQIFCPQTPTLPLTLGLGSKGQNLTSSEHCDVAYQIKELHKCSNMLADIYPQTTPLPPNPGEGISRCHGWIVLDWNERLSSHFEIYPVSQKVSEYYMIRKYPNHILQTHPRHRVEKSHIHLKH